MNKQLEKIEKYATNNNIPIMQKDGIEYLCNYIKNNNIINILEVGSAIGYSAIKMSLVNSNIHVTTLEKNEERFNEAISNINIFNLMDQITIHNIDAIDYQDNTKYDLIFIDASKGKNKYFFEKFALNLNDNGVIITDNLSFHGLVENPNLVQTKNQQGLVNKIKEYIEYLKNNKEFETIFIDIGDGISISKRNGDV